MDRQERTEEENKTLGTESSKNIDTMYNLNK